MLLADAAGGPVRARGRLRAHARDGALAHAAAVGRARHLRERRLPVPAPADRRRGGGGVGDRPRSATRGCRSGSCGRCWRSCEAHDEPWLTSLVGEHLDFAAVRHLAVLFDRYALHRPELVQTWAGHWQARALAGARARGSRRRIPRPGWRPRARGCGPSRASSTCRSGCRCSASRGCPPAQLHVLRALAEHRDVHLFLLHPVAGVVGADRGAAPRVTRRAGDPDGADAPQPPAGLLGTGRARAAARPRGRT